MRGPDLLLAHLAILSEEPPDAPDAGPSARERLDDALGSELAEQLLAALAPPPAG